MSDAIEISGLQFMGRHGVYEFEKERPQPFVVDLVIHTDLRPAAASDDLTATVSYSSYASCAAAVVEGESCNLIETIAERIATAVLSLGHAESVEVTVHKPRAPIGAPVTDVAVRIHRP